MFNSNDEESTDFCESYRTKILATNDSEEKKSFLDTLIKLITILFLLVLIIGISFYGYKNFMNKQLSSEISLPPQSLQSSDDDLIVTLKEPNIEDVANSVKIEISKNEAQEEVVKEKVVENISALPEKKLEIPSSEPEAKYLEELADLSKEIDKERK